MTESKLSSTLLEQDVRRMEADTTADGQSKSLDDVIDNARYEIEKVFSKQRMKLAVVPR